MRFQIASVNWTGREHSNLRPLPPETSVCSKTLAFPRFDGRLKAEKCMGKAPFEGAFCYTAVTNHRVKKTQNRELHVCYRTRCSHPPRNKSDWNLTALPLAQIALG
jgi:hypothetical protein